MTPVNLQCCNLAGLSGPVNPWATAGTVTQSLSPFKQERGREEPCVSQPATNSLSPSPHRPSSASSTSPTQLTLSHHPLSLFLLSSLLSLRPWINSGFLFWCLLLLEGKVIALVISLFSSFRLPVVANLLNPVRCFLTLLPLSSSLIPSSARPSDFCRRPYCYWFPAPVLPGSSHSLSAAPPLPFLLLLTALSYPLAFIPRLGF